VDDDGDGYGVVNFWGTPSVFSINVGIYDDSPTLNFYGNSSVSTLQTNGPVNFWPGSISNVLNFTVTDDEGNVTVYAGAAFSNANFWLNSGKLQIYSALAFGYLSLGGDIYLTKNSTVYYLDVNGGTLTSFAPYNYLAAIVSANILDDVTVTSATLAFIGTTTWTDGNLYAVGTGVIANYVTGTLTATDDTIILETGGTFINFGLIIFTEDINVETDDGEGDPSTGTFINSGTLSLGVDSASLEFDATVIFIQCPISGLLSFYIDETSEDDPPTVTFAGVPTLFDGNIVVTYSSTDVANNVDELGITLISFAGTSIFSGNVDTSVGSINSFCWSVNVDSDGTGYGTLFPDLDDANDPNTYIPTSCALIVPSGVGSPPSVCTTTAPPPTPLPPGAAPTAPTVPTPVAPAAPAAPTAPTVPTVPTPVVPSVPTAPHAPTPVVPSVPTAPHAPTPVVPSVPTAPVAPSTAAEKLVCVSLLLVSFAALVL